MSEYSGSAPEQAISARPEPRNWASVGVLTYAKIAAVAVLLWLVFREQIADIIGQWQEDASWSHGFLIPLFSLYFLNQRREEILSLRPRPNPLGLLMLIACIAFYVLNVVHFRVHYFGSLTIIAAIFGTTLYLGGMRLMRYAWLPILYLVFAVPLPGRVYRELTIPMRIFAAEIATFLLNLVPNLKATASGVVIDVVYKGVPLEPALNVAEACSGMRLLMAFVALGVAMAYLHERPIWQRLVLLISTVPIAILCNVVRVTVTGFIYILWDPKYAQGIYHDLLGILMLPLAFGIYAMLAWFMSNLFTEEAEHQNDVVYRRREQNA